MILGIERRKEVKEVVATEMQTASAEYALHQGTNCKAYHHFGCQRVLGDFIFRVLSPDASRVCLVGDFCGWDEGLSMSLISEDGVWECAVRSDRIGYGDKYKFKIFYGDRVEYRADVFAFASECPPNTASLVCDLDRYVWRDKGWLSHRRMMAEQLHDLPLNIYELDLATWHCHSDGSVMSYREVAGELATYVKQMGYTHIQLLPVWRRDLCSAFAPDSRMGGHEDFMFFVDSMHEAGVGVLLDWSFTEAEIQYYSQQMGQPYFEANALFWVDRYHVDGLCVGGERWNDIAANVARAVRSQYPDVILICREKKTDGFDLCFDGAWADELYECATTDAFLREPSYKTSADLRGRVLPVSYEGLINGKRTFLDKMSGDYWQKFAGARAFLGYMMTVGGKKLTFMGSEIGQFKEWDGESAVEWFLLEHDSHARLQRYVADLGQLYLRTPALWQEQNGNADGMCVSHDDTVQGIISYCRRDKDGNEVIVVINFTPVVYENYRLEVCCGGEYREIFNSDDISYGGSGVVNSETVSCDGDSSIVIKVPPLAVSILRCVVRTRF